MNIEKAQMQILERLKKQYQYFNATDQHEKADRKLEEYRIRKEFYLERARVVRSLKTN